VAATQTLPKQRRLRKRKEFLHTQTQGNKLRAGCLVGLVTHNSLGFCRLGMTVTKKVCNAVGRNKIRRKLRELFRKSSKAKTLPVDLVVVAVPGALEANLKEDFGRLVWKVRVSVLRVST
jgi:ribonuclease P protein component